MVSYCAVLLRITFHASCTTSVTVLAHRNIMCTPNKTRLPQNSNTKKKIDFKFKTMIL